MSRTTGLILIALLLAAVFFLSLPGTTAWQRVLQDAGHGPVFAGIAIVLLLMQSPGAVRSPPVRLARDYFRAFGLAAAIGIVSEFVQYLQPDRHVSFMDALHDMAGAALGLALFALFFDRRKSHDETGRFPAAFPTASLIATALGALVLLAWQPIQCATAYAERSRAFPTLLQATRAADLNFVQAREAGLERSTLPSRWLRADEGRALRLSFPSGTRPALELVEPAPDWRGHDKLMLDVTNPGQEALEFTLRILDAHHDWSHEDRFNMPVTIPPASRVTVQVSLAAIASAPAGRPMDMAAVANVMLFSRAPQPATEFYVSRLWLE